MAERDAARAELLRRFRRAAQGPDVRDDPDAAGPLSHAQERFALLESLHPGHPAHVLRGLTELRGPLDAERYARALFDVLQAHRGLRTRFYQDERGRWRQRVVPVEDLDLPRAELPADARGSRQEAALLERLEQLSAAPFDLGRAPLMRLELVRVHEEHHVLLSAVHHLAVDGLALLAWGADVAARYRALGNGDPAPTAPAHDPLDLARWQRTREAAGFWREAAAERRAELAELPELELPADRPRPADGATRGAREALALEADLRAAVRAQARAFGVTPFQIYLSAFAAELHASSGQAAFAIGVPVAGREHPATRGVLGYLSNSVAIATRRTRAATWREWVRETAAHANRALAAAEVPFEHLARELDPTGDRAQLARHPVFQVLFNYVDFTPAALDAGELRITYRARPAGTLFDLSLYVHDSPEQGLLEFEYEGLRFEAATVRRMLTRVRRRLQHAVAEPDGRAALQLVESPEEARRRFRLEGRARSRRARRGGVCERVERQVRERPDALAVAWREAGADRAWRYADLGRRVAQWRDLLERAGLAPGDRVAWAPRSDGDAVALPLALERAGLESCPLPLDLAPEHRERLARELAPHATWLPDERAADWRGAWPVERELTAPDAKAARASASPERDDRDLDRAAYRLHTSGTTGRPKAVVVSRGAWVAFLDAAVARLGSAAAGRWLAVTPVTFDIHLLERFAPLIAGGSVELVEPAEATSGERLAERLRVALPDVFQATPSTHRLLELAGYEGDGHAHWLIGGEPWYAGLAERAHAQAGAVWNAYGPTEATVWVSLTRLSPGDPVHLGRPLRGSAWRVADEHGNAAPCGAPGELWLAGPQLARGYAGDPERTRESFPVREGRRWYRTGDRVRFDGHGRLLHLGRLDDQIKLRGHRLELGAIDAALEALPGVAAAASALDRDAPEGGALVALLVAEPNGAPALGAAASAADWSAVWSHVFEQGNGPQAGWVDPELRRPFALSALRRLAEAFAERVVTWLDEPATARVLEIGAGGGLIATALAPRVARFAAQEPDPLARERLLSIEGVERVFEGRFGERIEALRDAGPFAAIVLHSVVQYLGSPAELVAGLERVRGALAPGGGLVLGDLLDAAEIEQRPAELALDPRSWAAWAERQPAVRSIELRARRDDPRFVGAPELLRRRTDLIVRFVDPGEPGFAAPLNDTGLEVVQPSAPPAAPLDPDFLHRALRGRLPAGQIPSAHRWVAELPRTSAGKLDRRAVLRAVRSRPRVAEGAGLSAAEDFAGEPQAAALAAIWSEVLGVPATRSSHFFEAGGHSLSAARFAALARERCPGAAHLELADVLRWPRFGDLLDFLAGHSGAGSGAGAAVESTNGRLDPHALNAAQRRLLVLEALDPGRATYHLSFELSGPLARVHRPFEEALQALRERHRALGLGLLADGGPAGARFVDLRGGLPLSTVDPSADFDATVFAARPFDLQHGGEPLWRVALFKGTSAWRLVWVLHHAIADARSVAVLAAEFARLLAGENLEPPRAGFDELQANAARRERGTPERVRAWAEELRPCAQPLAWPLADARPGASRAPTRGAADAPLEAAIVERTLEPGVAKRFRALAAERDVSGHALLLALAGEWLRGWTGQERFCLGTTLGGRDREELADAVGFAAETVVVPLDLGDLDPERDAVIERVQGRWTRCLQHADVGFEALVARLATDRDRERPPLFQVAVDHLGESPFGRWDASAEVVLREVPVGPAKFELTVQWIEAETTRVRFEFDPRRFDAATRRALVAEFERRLGRWLDFAPARDLPAPTPAACAAVRGTPLGAQLERRAQGAPGALAWQRGARAVSFDALLAARRRWSGALRQRGVVRGQRVGVAVEDPGEFALALWSLWALGAVPVAVQAGDAPARRAERLTHAGCSEWIGLEDAAWRPSDLERGAECQGDFDADHDALVLFTSGTSGRPKAVRVGQASLANYLNGSLADYALERGAIAFTDPAFDLGLTCALGPWWHGGTLHTGAGRDALERLEACLAGNARFGALKLTPTHLRALAGAGLVERFDGRLEHLIVGGERLDYADLAPWRELRRPPLVHNEYGPTEATVAVCTSSLDLGDSDPRAAGPVPVSDADRGFIDGLGWVLVDERGEPVSDGAPGELWLSGTPLALGYDDAEATRAAFPVCDGVRWYRTGDRAMRRAAGLTILGRTDAELKVRGVRVDPEELEQRLGALPGLGAVAVSLRSLDGRPQLIAFCTGGAALPPRAADLGRSLPRALWPDRWQAVSSLPTRGHGKLDRGRVAALPLAAPAEDAPSITDEARDGSEPPDPWPPHPLAELLRDVLGSDARPDRDFFANGGDSIAALTASARARQAGWDLSVAALFEADSLHAALAAAREDVGSPPAGQVGPRGLTDAQLNYARGLAEPAGWDVQAVAVRFESPLPGERVRAALERLVERHGALRTCFRMEHGRWVQTELPTGQVRVEAAPADAWSARAGAAFGALRPEAALVCGALIDDPGRCTALLLYVHHLAVDAQSWRVLLPELEALLSDRPGDLGPAVPASAFSPPPEAHADADESARPDPGFGSEGRARRLERALTSALLERYARLAASSALPPVDQALAAAWVATLQVHFGVDDGVHLESAGRREPCAAGAVGFFSEWLPIESTPGVEFDRDPAASLRRVSDSRWRAACCRQGSASALLNHLGRWSAPHTTTFAVTPFDGAPWRSPDAPLRAGHELRSSERDGTWTLEWIAPEYVVARDLELALDDTLARFARLVAQLERNPARALAPASFGLAGAADAWLGWSAREAHVQDASALSPTQLGMLLESLERPESAAYREQFWLELDADWSAPRVEAALVALARRHPALRSVFHWRGSSRPVRVVRRAAEVALEVLDARDLDWLDRDLQWELRAARGRAADWDLSSAPPWRVVFQRRADRRARLLFEYHHVLLDGWSLPTLLTDLERALDGAPLDERRSPRRTAEPGERREGPIPAEESPARAFWDARFADYARPPRRLVAERRRGTLGDRGSRGPDPGHRVLRRTLSTDRSRAIERGARDAGATPALLLQAAWARVLQRFSGSLDVAFALTQSGRRADGPQAEVGAFLRTVAVRVPESWRAAAQDPWSPAGLGPWRADARDREPHEALPLARQVAAAGEGPERVLESLVVFENYPRPQADRAGGGPRWIDAGGFERTPFPLTWIVVPGERWSLELCGASERVDPDLQRALFEALFEELGGAALDPRRWERAVEFAREVADERAIEGDAEDALWARLRSASERALWRDSERAWTGGEIASGIARRQAALVARGIGPGSIVAVDLGDPVERAFALLAVWATGAAPWTVDRDDAEPRRARAARSAGPDLWIGDRPAPEGIARVAPEELSRASDADLAPVGAGGAGSLGALAFTSGSTGEPKGIELPRAPFFAKLRALAERYGWTADDELPAFAAPGFDTAYEELLGSLFAGARLHFDAAVRRASFAELEARLATEAWTVLDLPTAYWNAWALERASAPPVAAPNLRQVILGGQAVDPHALAAWRKRWPGVELLNSYGPTETTVVSVAGELDTESDPHRTPSIGRALPGVSVELGGAQGPERWSGELWLHDPATRTAERGPSGRRTFAPGAAYATGDLVLRDVEGRLRFLGRADDQVKLRGRRVELDEVEAVLARANVAARAALDEDGRLVVGYLGERATAEVARILVEQLPEWMQPAFLASVEDWPRTPRGKLDRAALASAVRERALALEVRAVDATPDADPWIARARAAFAEALGRESVDPDARLDELGGDSLSALAIASRAAGSGRAPRLGALLDAPTARAWARELERVQAAEADEGDARSADEDAPTAAAHVAWAAADPGWRFARDGRSGARDTVWITGATGLLGAHVAAELARLAPHANVAVAVRARDDEAARERWLVRWAEVRGALPLDRVEVWRADLSRPRFGWSVEQCDERRERVTHVVHAAADTSPTASLAELLRHNVQTTRHLLEWLAGGGAVQLHAISTLGIFEGLTPGEGAPWNEVTPLSALGRQRTPYPASKWLSEQLLENARALGLDVTRYRPGRLLPEWNERHRDPWAAALGAWVAESRAVLDGELELDARPARDVAREIALSLVAGARVGERPAVVHLDGDRPWSLARSLEARAGQRPGWRRLAWPELAAVWRALAESRGELGMFAVLERLVEAAEAPAAGAAARVGNGASRVWLASCGAPVGSGPRADFWAELDPAGRP